MSTPLPSDSDEIAPIDAVAEPTSTPAGTADYKAVARVSTQAKLVSVRLRTVTASAQCDPGSVPAGWSDSVTVMTTSSALVNGSSLKVSCSFIGKSDARPEIEIAADFELAYELGEPDKLSGTDVEQFALVNGKLHAWPYWRELAQSMSVRMGLPALMIPTFKIPSPYDPRNQIDDGTTDRAPASSPEPAEQTPDADQQG